MFISFYLSALIILTLLSFYLARYVYVENNICLTEDSLDDNFSNTIISGKESYKLTSNFITKNTLHTDYPSFIRKHMSYSYYHPTSRPGS